MDVNLLLGAKASRYILLSARNLMGEGGFRRDPALMSRIIRAWTGGIDGQGVAGTHGRDKTRKTHEGRRRMEKGLGTTPLVAADIWEKIRTAA